MENPKKGFDYIADLHIRVSNEWLRLIADGGVFSPILAAEWSRLKLDENYVAETDSEEL